MSERQVVHYTAGDVRGEERKKCVSFIIKYKVESKSWKEVTSFDHLDARRNVCIIPKDDIVYFIGGEERFAAEDNKYEQHTLLTDVHRYNISRNKWDKVADILQAKAKLNGAACKGRIFIAGRPGSVEWGCRSVTCQCEVYNETTNEWQFISSFHIRPGVCPKLLSVDDQLYAFGCWMFHRPASAPDTSLKCYDPHKNEWIWKADIPIPTHSLVKAYSGRVFKGFLSKQQLISVNSGRHFPPASQTKVSKGKCVIA